MVILHLTFSFELAIYYLNDKVIQFFDLLYCSHQDIAFFFKFNMCQGNSSSLHYIVCIKIMFLLSSSSSFLSFSLLLLASLTLYVIIVTSFIGIVSNTHYRYLQYFSLTMLLTFNIVISSCKSLYIEKEAPLQLVTHYLSSGSFSFFSRGRNNIFKQQFIWTYRALSCDNYGTLFIYCQCFTPQLTDCYI